MDIRPTTNSTAQREQIGAQDRVNLLSGEDEFSSSSLQGASCENSSCCFHSLFSAIGNCFCALFALLKSFFCCGKRVEERDAEGFTPLSRAFHEACLTQDQHSLTNHLDEAAKLIKQGSDVSGIDAQIAITNGENSSAWRQFLVDLIPHVDIDLRVPFEICFYNPEGKQVSYYLAIITLAIKKRGLDKSKLYFNDKGLKEAAFDAMINNRNNNTAWNNFYNFLAYSEFNENELLMNFYTRL